MTEPDASPSPSGLERTEIEKLLAGAEPDRIAALSASLSLTVAAAFMIGGQALLTGHLGLTMIGVVVAIAVWHLSNRFWRDRVLEVIAPAMGAGWGQSDFASGWGRAVPVEDWLRDMFDREGARFTAWQSQGRYHDVDYRLSEVSIPQPRRGRRRREVIHILQVELSVPRSFSGTVEISPNAGFMSKVDDVLRQLTGDAERRLGIDPAFDAVFDTKVTANAPVEELLTPGFREAMLRLAARYPRLYLSGRFERGWFSLRLPIPHLVFSSARLLTPMRDLEGEADALWWDLTVPHRLIDGLMGQHYGPLR